MLLTNDQRAVIEARIRASAHPRRRAAAAGAT
jgi:hypothetical protein